MNIFFNGCSMVYGKDLVPQTIEQENDPYDNSHIVRTRSSWPGVLSASLNATQVNLARCGSSMDCIFRTTYAEFNVNMHSHAIIGLTEPLRFEFFDQDTEKYSQVVLPRGSYKKMYPRSMHRFLEDVAWFFFADHACLTKYALNILAIQYLFKSTGTPYYFVNSLADYVTPCIDRLPWFAKQFDSSCWDSSTSMFEFCKSEGVPFGSTVHPLQEGHAMFAGHVARLVTTKWKV